MTSTPIFAALVLLAATLPLATVQSIDLTDCSTAEPVMANDHRSGVVAPGESHWYVHQAVGEASQVLQPGPASDVDLIVYDADCSTILCSSYAGTGVTDSCHVDGGQDYRVEVTYWSGVGDYTIDFYGDHPDADGDGVPDDVEGFVCGSPAVEDAINDRYPLLGRCATPTDYEGPTYLEIRVPVPFAKEGEDADADGFPSRIGVVTREVHFHPLKGVWLSQTETPFTSQRVDADDTNPNVPVLYEVVVGPFPTDVTPGADADRDLIPSGMTVHYTSYRVTRGGSVTPIDSGSSFVRLDTNDTNPNEPVIYLPGLVDTDGDLVLDAAEPAICAFENRNSNVDGHCTAGVPNQTPTPDYHPPWEAVSQNPWGVITDTSNDL